MDDSPTIHSHPSLGAHFSRREISVNFKPLFLMSCLGLAGLTTSCNVFDPFDSPTSDVQLLSAARACFDQGKFDCALEHYGKLSGSHADIAAAEMAFMQLDQAGAGMGALMKAVGNGGSGGAASLSRMAGSLAPSAGEVKRQQILAAYLKAKNIQDPSLRGLVRFTSAFALAAEILGEETRGSAVFTQLNLVRNVDGCKAAPVISCNLTTDCTTIDPVIQVDATMTAIDRTTAAAADFDSAPTWRMVHFAVSEIVFALESELAASGKFSSGLGSFSGNLLSEGASAFTVDGCYRQLLLNTGVGEQ
jgi:hypothetical protein